MVVRPEGHINKPQYVQSLFGFVLFIYTAHYWSHMVITRGNCDIRGLEIAMTVSPDNNSSSSRWNNSRWEDLQPFDFSLGRSSAATSWASTPASYFPNSYKWGEKAYSFNTSKRVTFRPRVPHDTMTRVQYPQPLVDNVGPMVMQPQNVFSILNKYIKNSLRENILMKQQYGNNYYVIKFHFQKHMTCCHHPPKFSANHAAPRLSSYSRAQQRLQ